MSRRTWRGSVVGFLVAMVLSAFAVRSYSAPLEYQVKASYLYNFIQFIEWPKDAFSGQGFNLCVVGAERFGAALDGFAGERIEGHEITVRRLARASQARATRCHLLFVAAGLEPLPAEASSQHGLLTIGETPDFLAQGGIINLVEMRGRIRFEISQPAAHRAGLNVSSRILSLAVNKP